MNATIVLNLATLAISLTALVISILLTLRQLRLTRGGIHLPVVLDAFKETRSAAWFEAQEYVLTELAQEHQPDYGHRGLPEQARTRANTIGLFYDDLGKLVAHGMIDQSLVIGSYGTNIVRLWTPWPHMSTPSAESTDCTSGSTSRTSRHGRLPRIPMSCMPTCACVRARRDRNRTQTDQPAKPLI